MPRAAVAPLTPGARPGRTGESGGRARALDARASHDYDVVTFHGYVTPCPPPIAACSQRRPRASSSSACEASARARGRGPRCRTLSTWTSSMSGCTSTCWRIRGLFYQSVGGSAARHVGRRRRGAAAAGAAERGPPVHRRRCASASPCSDRARGAQGGRHQPPGRARAPEVHVPVDRRGARGGFRSRPGAAPRVDSARLDERHAGRSARSLCAALSPGGDPGRSPGAQPARIRPLPAGGGAVQRAGHQRRRHRPRRRGRPHHGAGISRHPRGHAARLPAAGLRSPGARAGAPAAEAVLGRSRRRARHQAPAREPVGRRARPAVRELGPDDLRAHAETQQLFEEIGYWSPHQTRTEVDFVCAGGGSCWPSR